MLANNGPNGPNWLDRLPPSARRARTRQQGLQRLYRIRARQERREDQQRSDRARSPWVIGAGVLVGLVGIFLGGLLLVTATTASAYNSLTRDLPSLSKINNRASFKTAQIFDRKGTLLWEFNDPNGGKRLLVPLNQVSQHLIDASLAAEDAYFYQHSGVDLRATVRSAVVTGSGESRTGASTITQQLVRAVLLDPKEAQQITVTRKLREIILAYELDQRLPKDQILEMYLNEVYYGNQAYGVEAASLNYFDKHARDLTIAEAALVAGLVQSPSTYDPTRTDVPRTADGIPIITKERQAYVLEQMARHGFITEQEAREAYAQPLKIKPQRLDLKAPHWVMYIRDQLIQKYGEDEFYRGGLRIYTTLDADYNDKMLEVLQNNKPNIDKQGGHNAALMAVNPKTGEILAFNGSMDYDDPSIDGQVNVLLSQRQPGSSIKPLIYEMAFEKGWAPGTFIDDVPTCWPDRPGHQWCPVNFDNQFHGQVTARTALGNSLNIPAVKTLQFDGLDAIVQRGREVGIESWDEDSSKTFGLALTLGGAEVRPYELAQLYGTLANNGLKIPLVSVTRIVDAEGNVLEDYKVPQGEQVMDPRGAYMITDVLSDPAAKLFTYGPTTPLIIRRDNQIVPAASKTGTTDNYKDTWTAGYTPSLVIVVWVGNTNGAAMHEVLSSMTAGKIWPEAMQASFDYFKTPYDAFPRPSGLSQQTVCGDTRMRPGQPACRQDLFYTERTPNAPVGSVPAPAPKPTPQQPAQPAPAGQTQPAAPQPAAPAPAPQPAPPQLPQPNTKPQNQNPRR